MGRLEDIQVFLRVVEAGGISRAAEQLNIAKSAVSRRLAELENRLKVKLIQRTTRQFHLTEAGQRYYERAIEVVDSVKELDGLVSEESDHFEGRLTISIPLSFGLLHMTKAIDEFMQLHPNLELNVNLSDREVNLIEEGVDVAFRIGKLHDSSIQARKVVPIRIALYASPSYLQKHGEPEDVEQLSRLEFLRYSEESSPAFELTAPTGEIETLVLKGKVQANNGDFLKELAISGHGVVVMPTFICWRELESGQLIQLLPDHQIGEVNAYAVYPQNRFLSKSARGFIDFLVAYFADEPYWDLIKADAKK